MNATEIAIEARKAKEENMTSEEILKDRWEYHSSVSGGHSFETFKHLCVTDLEFATIWLFYGEKL